MTRRSCVVSWLLATVLLMSITVRPLIDDTIHLLEEDGRYPFGRVYLFQVAEVTQQYEDVYHTCATIIMCYSMADYDLTKRQCITSPLKSSTGTGWLPVIIRQWLWNSS